MSIVGSITINGNGLFLSLLTSNVMIEVGLDEFEGGDNRMSAARQMVANTILRLTFCLPTRVLLF